MWTELTDMAVSTVRGRPGLFCWYAARGHQVGEMSGPQHSHEQGALVSFLGSSSQQPRQESSGCDVAPRSPVVLFIPRQEEKGTSRAR